MWFHIFSVNAQTKMNNDYSIIYWKWKYYIYV